MDWHEYVRIKLSDIPQEFIDKFNLTELVHNGWMYFEIIRYCYGLPQSGKFANDLPCTWLEKAVYYEVATTPGLWHHKWRPIQYFLIEDDFVIKYVGKQHALHLLKIMEQNYEITADWEGQKFSGINLEWKYTEQHSNRTSRISTNGYIDKLLIKYEHPRPRKLQLSPHKHCEVTHGAKEQLTPEEDTSTALDNEGTKHIQSIVGEFLYYSRVVDNKLLGSLSKIGAQQAATTQCTKEAINQLLYYSAIYPTDGILYRSSNMVLWDHSDAGFHNVSKGRSRSSTHIFLSKNDTMQQWNTPVLTLDQIIKFVMSSSSEVELGAIFITSQQMVLMRNTLKEVRWPQPKSPIQTENSGAAGVVNNTIVPGKLKTMDHHLHWFWCRETQDQFRYHWASVSLNWGDSSNKRHPHPPLSQSKHNEIHKNYWEHIRNNGVLFQVPCGTYFHLEP